MVIAQGTPEDVAKVEGSYTGQFLKSELEDRAKEIETSPPKKVRASKGLMVH